MATQDVHPNGLLSHLIGHHHDAKVTLGAARKAYDALFTDMAIELDGSHAATVAIGAGHLGDQNPKWTCLLNLTRTRNTPILDSMRGLPMLDPPDSLSLSFTIDNTTRTGKEKGDDGLMKYVTEAGVTLGGYHIGSSTTLRTNLHLLEEVRVAAEAAAAADEDEEDGSLLSLSLQLPTTSAQSQEPWRLLF